ncbi:MAG: glycosyltransferase involved in cell wall biosynthesis [Psychromonas sp.]|jgi:glycosyltransferase involved in cell wall biosynthesis|uniref:glycosyltransferase n=1 Tax=Psychromonas sp. TaxID=1884585 RepID=UPI0039E6AAEF
MKNNFNGLFVINSLEGGGAEKVFASLMSLIEEDKGKEYDFDVVILDELPEVYSLPESITIHRLGNRFGRVGQFIKFLIIVKKVKPTFVVSFLFRSNHFNAIAGCIFKYRCIISERSNTNGRIIGRFKSLKKLLVKTIFDKSDAIVCVSEGVGECLITDYSISPSKIKLLNNPYNDVELIALSKLSNEDYSAKKYIVAVGRLVKTKGFDDLIIAFSKANISCDLKILGQGPELERLKEISANNGVCDRVEFCGFQKNPYPYISNSILFVLPSHLEGFPNALVEAMTLSKPVIASNCTDGPKEILGLEGSIDTGVAKQAKFGLIYSPGDFKALASGLETYINSEELLKKYAKLSRKRSKDFSREKFYSQFNLLLAAVVGGS